MAGRQVHYQYSQHGQSGSGGGHSMRSASFESSSGSSMSSMPPMPPLVGSSGVTVVQSSSSPLGSPTSFRRGSSGMSMTISGPSKVVRSMSSASTSVSIPTSNFLPGVTEETVTEVAGEKALIHREGYDDNISRFMTEDFSMCHRHLSDSLALGRSRVKNGRQVQPGDEERDKLRKLAERIMSVVLQAESFAEVNVLNNLRELSAMGHVDRVCTLFAEVATEMGFADFFATVWLKLNQIDIRNQLRYPGEYIAVNLLLDATQRFTEVNKDLCREFGRRCLPALLSILTDPFYSSAALNGDSDQTRWMSRVEFLKKIFAIFFNCVRKYPDNRNIFRVHNAAEYLKTFLDNRFIALRSKALMILSYIVTEEENTKLNTDAENVELVIEVLANTVSEDPGRSDHYSANSDNFAVEVVDAMQHMAVSDDNKKALVNSGVLPHLVPLMNGWEDERAAALDALWVLSFHPDNKDAIRREDGCIDAVKRYMHDGDNSQQCKSILWNLGDFTPDAHSPQSQAFPFTAMQAEGPLSQTEDGSRQYAAEKTTNHVMISYQWDVQEQILAVNALLKANGYSIWIDVEQMGGSTLEAMAEAVENAAVVILCFSEKYKESPACRTEAEYTYKLRKPVIPLKMQTGYDPDGWLGAMLGTKFYIEMYTSDLVQKNGPILLRELGSRGRDAQGRGNGKAITNSKNGKPRPGSSSEVARWDDAQVMAWLANNGFRNLARWFRGWGGLDMLGLKEMATHAPDFFYKKMETEFGMATTLELVRFKTLLNTIA